MFGQDIARQLSNLNSVPSNFRDIYQSVWVRLLTGDVIAKFHQKVAQTRPATLTAKEVADHLGISLGTWVEAQAAYLQGVSDFDWLPLPVEGSALDAFAVWSTDDIEAFERSGSFEREESVSVVPQATLLKFKSYLATAVHNAYSNWCRTHKRRYKERVIDCHAPWLGGSTSDPDALWERVHVSHEHERLDTQLSVRAAVAKSVQHRPIEGEYFSLLVMGYTMTEAAQVVGMSRAHAAKVNQRLAARM